MIRCIVAIDSKNGIATDEGIPWKLPTDLQFFRDQVSEGIILMGIGTYREFTEPMHGRTNYVATHSQEQLLPGFERVEDVEAFLQAHKTELINDIGGAGLFASTLQYADELLITQIEADFHCTKFFPPYEADFKCIKRSDPVTENGVVFRFTTWVRKS